MANWEQKRSSGSPEYNLLTKDHLPKNKVSAFITVFKVIIKAKGSILKAAEEAGVSHATAERMLYDKVLSAGMGRKILNCYNRIKNESK